MSVLCLLTRPAVAAALIAAPLQARPAPAVPYETVSFPSLDPPVIIGAALFRPEGPGPFPAVVALHGASGLGGRTALYANYQDWGTRLRDAGYVVLFPDSFRARGLDHGVATLKHDPVPPDRERVKDVFGALRFLQSLPWVRRDRIALLGWSHGGATVLSAVEAGLPVPQPGFRVAVAFYPGTWRQLRNPSWKPGIPLSILIGLKDDWTPAEGCVRLAERIHAQGLALDLVTYPNANHGFDAPKVPLHVRTGVNSHTGSATVGTDPDARQDALTHTMTIFHQALD